MAFVYSSEDVKMLRNESGLGIQECKMALTLSEGNFDIALKFLELKYSAVSRYKMVGNEKCLFTDEDYLLLAKEKINEKDIEMSV